MIFTPHKISDRVSRLLSFFTETDLTIYRVEIQSGVATVMECINISSDLHVKLSFEGFPIPLPNYISNSKGSKISNLDMLTNLPNYCRNITHNYDIEPLKDLLQLVHYSPKGKCKYSTRTLRFALQLRYTSNAAYNQLRQYTPLPSQRLLRCLKSDSIDSIKAFFFILVLLFLIIIEPMFLRSTI